MRNRHLAGALVLSLASALCAVSCVRNADPSAEPEDDDEPINNTPILAEEPGVLGLAKDLCLAMANAGPDARAEFCRSAVVPPHKKQGCWMRVFLSPAEWTGWCNWNF